MVGKHSHSFRQFYSEIVKETNAITEHFDHIVECTKSFYSVILLGPLTYDMNKG